MKAVGLINVRQYNESYQRIIKELGARPVLFDIYDDKFLSELNRHDRKVDFYFWQSIDRGRFYRKMILDPVYFIDKYSKRKIFPDFNQYFSFNDKLKQYHIFQALGIPTPKTFFTASKEGARSFIKKTKYPFVLKDPHSSSGFGVYLVKNKKAAGEYIEKIFSRRGLNNLYNQFYAQEFIPDLKKSLRVIVIGSKTYCAYWRVSGDDWKHHVTPESKVSDKNIPSAALRLCEKISHKMGYHWMAYDVLVKNNKFYIIEFSCNFGVWGAESLGYNPRQEIIKYSIKNS